MRFCPFCSAENADAAIACAACARRLPPLPARRQRPTASGPAPVAPVVAPPFVAAPVVEAPAVAAAAPSAALASPAAAAPAAGPAAPVSPVAAGPAAPVSPVAAEPLAAPVASAAPTSSMAAEPSAAPVPALPADLEPPPTRLFRPETLVERPFVEPVVMPVPEVPEPGTANAVRYVVAWARARWQRRVAVRRLGDEIRLDTTALDDVLRVLGAQYRAAGVEARVVAAENAALDRVEARRGDLDRNRAELEARRAEEATRFDAVEREKRARVDEADRLVAEAGEAVERLEAQRRTLRDKRKEVERRQQAYARAAEERDTEAGAAPMGDTRSELRRLAEGHRREHAALEPERQALERQVAELERPLAAAQARHEAVRGEQEVARRALHDAREGHRQRVAELDAEHARKARELAQAGVEIQQRLVTLGTLINLERIDHPAFSDVYARIDRLRDAIGARTLASDRLTAEAATYDRTALVRGCVAIGVGVVVAVTFVAVLAALA